MKKVLGPIISMLTGLLTFVFLSLPHLLRVDSIWEDKYYTNAWDLIKTADKDIDGSIFVEVMTIIVAVMAGILILYGLVYLLGNLKVFKTKANLKVLNDVLLGLMVVMVVIQLMALVALAKTWTGSVLFESASPAIGMWLNLGLAAGACLVSVIFTRPVKSKSKKK